MKDIQVIGREATSQKNSESIVELHLLQICLN